jgi:hypothetical protein
MPMTYAQALKAYAQKHGKFILPKKGSSEYAEVRSMMEAELGRDTPEQIGRQNRASEIAKKPNATSEGNLVVSDASELKTTKGASTKNKKRIEPPPMKTKMIDDPADELKGKKVEEINYNPCRNEPILYKNILITKTFNPSIPITFNVKSFLSLEPYLIYNNFPGIFTEHGILEYKKGNKAPWRSIINEFFNTSIIDGIHLKSKDKSLVHFEKYFNISIENNLQIILEEKLNFNPMGIYHILFFIISQYFVSISKILLLISLVNLM